MCRLCRKSRCTFPAFPYDGGGWVSAVETGHTIFRRPCVKKSMASLFGAALLGLVLSSPAFEVSDLLQQKVQQELDILRREGPKMGDTMFMMREAGGAYLPEIVEAANADKYQSMEKRRIMVGIYWMDLTYASTFHQAEPAAKYGQAICQLLDSLGYPWPDMERRYREALEQIDQPGGEDEIWDLFREQSESIEWQEMLKDGEGLELVVDGLYGYLLEGLYLATEIAVQSNYEPNYMRFVGDTKNAFQAFDRLLALFTDEPELAALVQQQERAQFTTVLLNIIGSMPEVGEDQVNAIRAFTRKYRNDVMK